MVIIYNKICRVCGGSFQGTRMSKYCSDKCREGTKGITTIWARNNKERNNKTQRDYRLKLKIEIFTHYGNQCKCCGESMIDFLTIDHIKNNGATHNKKIRKYNSAFILYSWLKKNNFPEGYQTLCLNCNIGKRVKGYCPHNPDNPL